MSTFSIFNRGLDGMNVNLRRLSTAANNVANVHTPGYSRQVVDVQSRVGGRSEAFLGGGVETVGVRRIVDKFIELQLFNLAGKKGTLEGRQGSVQALESIFTETKESGMNKALSDFFNGFRELAADPTNPSIRVGLREKAQTLTSEFNRKSTELKKLIRNMGEEIETRLTTINDYLEEIAGLNDRIVTTEAANASGSFELRDRRTYVMQQLSSEMNVSFFENGAGAIQVFAGTGFALVQDGLHATLSFSDDLSAGGLASVELTDVNGSGPYDITASITDGRLGGNLTERNNNIQARLNNLDELAYQITEEINTLHFAGFGLNGATGNNFFTTLGSSVDAATAFALDGAILNDIQNIAAAQADPLGAGNGVADNRQALAIAALESQALVGAPARSFAQYYRDTIGALGVTGETVARDLQMQTSLYEATLAQRETVSGVSMDEEGSDLIKFQRAFEASARLLQVGSEMLQTILEI